MNNFISKLFFNSKFKPNPNLYCNVDKLVSNSHDLMPIGLDYNESLMNISIGDSSDRPTYEIDLKDSNDKVVGYLIAHVHNNYIEDYSLFAYNNFDWRHIYCFPITEQYSFGDTKDKIISLLGKPEEDIKGDTNSIIYFKNKDNKKYYFEFEFFNQSLCALHVGLSN